MPEKREYTMIIKWILLATLVTLVQSKTWTFNYQPNCVLTIAPLPVDIYTNANIWISGANWVKPRLRIYTGSPPSGYSDIGQAPFAWRYWPGIDYTTNAPAGGDRAKLYLSYFRFINLDDNLRYVPVSNGNPEYSTASATVTFGDHYIDIHSDFFFTHKQWRVEWIPPPPGAQLDFWMLPANFISYESGVTYNGERGGWYATMSRLSNVVCASVGTIPEEPFLLTQSFYYTPATSTKRRFVLDFNRAVTSCAGSGGNLPTGASVLGYAKSINPVKPAPGAGPYTCVGCVGTKGTTWSIEDGVNSVTDCLDPSTVATTRYLPVSQVILFGQPSAPTVCVFPTSLGYSVQRGLDQSDSMQGVGDGIDSQGQTYLVQPSVLRSLRRMGHLFDPTSLRLAHIVTNMPVPIDDSATSLTLTAAGYHPNDNFASIIEVPNGGNWTTSVVGPTNSVTVRIFTPYGLGQVALFSPASLVPIFDMDYSFLPASIASVEPEVVNIGGTFRIVYKVTTTTFFPRGNVFLLSYETTPVTFLTYTCPECSQIRYLDYRYLIPVEPVLNISLSMCIQFDPSLMQGSFVGDKVCGSKANRPVVATDAVIVDFPLGDFWGFVYRVYFNNSIPFNYFAGAGSVSVDCTFTTGQPASFYERSPEFYPYGCPRPYAAWISSANSIDLKAKPREFIYPGNIVLVKGLLLAPGEESIAETVTPRWPLPVTYEIPPCRLDWPSDQSLGRTHVKFVDKIITDVVNNGVYRACTACSARNSFAGTWNPIAYCSNVGDPVLGVRLDDDRKGFSMATDEACGARVARYLQYQFNIPFAIRLQGFIHGGWPFGTYTCLQFSPPAVTGVTCDGGDIVFTINDQFSVTDGALVPFVCNGTTYQGTIYGHDARSLTVVSPEEARETTCTITVTMSAFWFPAVTSTHTVLICSDKLFAPLQAVIYPTRLFVQFAPIAGFIPSSVDPAKWIFECLNETSSVEYVTITSDLTWMELAIPLCLRPADNDTTYYGSLQLLDGAFATQYGGQINASAKISALYSDEVTYYSDCTSLPNGEWTTTFTIFGAWEFISAADREPCNRKDMRLTDQTIAFTIAGSRYEACGSYVTLSGPGNRRFVLELVYGSCDRPSLKYDTIYRYTPALNYDISKPLSYYERDITFVTDDSDSGFGPLEWKGGIVSYNRYSLGLNFSGKFDCTYFFGPSVATAISSGTAVKMMDTWFNPTNDILQYSVEVWARPDLTAGNNWLLAFSPSVTSSTLGEGTSGCKNAQYSAGIWARSIPGGSQVFSVLGMVDYDGKIRCEDGNGANRLRGLEGFEVYPEVPEIDQVGAYSPQQPGSAATEVFQGVMTVYAQKIEPPTGNYARVYYNYTIRYVYWSKNGRKEFLSTGIAGTQAVCANPTPFCIGKSERPEFVMFKDRVTKLILAPVYTSNLDPNARSRWCPDVLPPSIPGYRPYEYSPQMFTGQLYRTAMYGRALSDVEIDDLWTIGLPNSRPAARATFIRILEDTQANLNASLDLYDFDIMELGRTDQTLQVVSLTLKSGRGRLVYNDTVFFVPELCTFGQEYAEVSVVLFDGMDYSREWVVPIHVTHVNHAPVPTNVSSKVLIDLDSPVTITGVDCDQGDSITVTVLLEPPSDGVVYHPVTRLPILSYPVQFPGSTFYYRPEPSLTVPDQYDTVGYVFIPFLVTDSLGLNSTAPAWIQLNVSNNVQPGVPSVLRVVEDTLTPFDITSGFDTRGYPVIYKIMTLPVNGTLYQDSVPVEFASLPFEVTGQLQYQGCSDCTGPDAFTFIAQSTNNSRQSSRGTFEILVEPVNDPPSTGSLFGPELGYTFAPVEFRARLSLELVDADSLAFEVTLKCSRGIQVELSTEAKWLFGNWSTVDPDNNYGLRGNYLEGNIQLTLRFSRPVLTGLLRNFTVECGTVGDHEIVVTFTDGIETTQKQSVTRTIPLTCLDGTALFGSGGGSSLLGTIVVIAWSSLAAIGGFLSCYCCVWPCYKKYVLRPQVEKLHKATGVASGRLTWKDLIFGKNKTKSKHKQPAIGEEEEEEPEIEQALLH